MKRIIAPAVRLTVFAAVIAPVGSSACGATHGVRRFKGNGSAVLAPFKTGLHGASVTCTYTDPHFLLYDDAQGYVLVDAWAPPQFGRTPGTSYIGPGRHQLSATIRLHLQGRVDRGRVRKSD